MLQRPYRRKLLAIALLVAAIGDGGIAAAQGRLEAKYQVTLAGVPFGTGTWHVEVGENQFTAAVSGATTGLVQLFASGRGSSASRGTVTGGQPVGQAYSSTIATDTKHDEVRIQMNSGTVKQLIAEPPTGPDPERVPLTEAHRRGVQDPMTASLLRVPGTGDTFVPQACNRKVAIFDGRMRYDMQLAFKRLDRVKSPKGYQGTAVVCAVYFSPVAGHIPSRPVIKYLVQMRNIELWLAPIAGTRLMVPYRAVVPTPVGQGVLQATQFITIPHASAASRPSPSSVKQQ